MEKAELIAIAISAWKIDRRMPGWEDIADVLGADPGFDNDREEVIVIDIVAWRE